jgi:hypothetical protein
MTLAAPLFAWMAAVAGPIILLYLIRQRLRSKPVSTLLFWQQLSPKVHNLPLWRRLRRILSLLLQLLFVALLVLALCRPLLPWQSANATSLVLVMDPSVSMSADDAGDSRWQRALDLAAARIDSMQFFDQTALIAASNPPRVLSSWSNRPKELREALRSLEPAATQTDVRPALDLARNLVSGRPNGRVEMVTDGVWTVMPDEPALAAVQLQLLGERRDNAGLTLFAARRSITAPGEYQLTARLEHNRPEKISGELEILRNGGLVDVVPVLLEPGVPWRRDWTAQEPRQAEFEARFTPSPPDALAGDNAAVATLPPLAPIEVELVSEPNVFLETALNSQPLVKWKRTWPLEQLKSPGESESAGRLYIFANVVPPPGFKASNILLLNPATEGFWGKPAGEIDRPMVSDAVSEDELLRFVDLRDILIRTASAFEPPPGARVFASSFGQPLIFGQWRGEPRWLAVAFDFNTSDFMLRTAFPILLGNLAQTLRHSSGDANAILPGPVESGLGRAPELDAIAGARAPSPAPAPAAWIQFPVWWWLALAGVLWLLGEWFTYSRRITE